MKVNLTLYCIGDNPSLIAHEFAEQHKLSQKMYEKLQNMLKQQMAGILSRINEEEYDDGQEQFSDSKILQ